MKTNRYVTQSAVVLGLFALLTVPQVVGQADEATAPVSTTSTETVADSGASVVSGQGTSGTAVQGGTEIVSATPTTVATNASTEPSANTSTTQASQEASAVLTNANQVTPAVPVQAETVTTSQGGVFCMFFYNKPPPTHLPIMIIIKITLQNMGFLKRFSLSNLKLAC